MPVANPLAALLVALATTIPLTAAAHHPDPTGDAPGAATVQAVPPAPPAPTTPPAPTREHLAPAGWEGSYHGLHYTPVLKIGDRVIVSGIPAIEGDGDEAKIRWMFAELERHLATAGATLADVVEISSFHVATDHADFRRRLEPMIKVHREVFRDHYPAWTAVGTTALFSAGAPVELRAEAVIGSGRAPRAEIPVPAPPAAPAGTD